MPYILPQILEIQIAREIMLRKKLYLIGQEIQLGVLTSQEVIKKLHPLFDSPICTREWLVQTVESFDERILINTSFYIIDYFDLYKLGRIIAKNTHEIIHIDPST